MAYSATTTATHLGTINGRRHVLLSVVELEAVAASEATITHSSIPLVGTIKRFTADSSVNIDPEFGTAAAYTDAKVAQLFQNGTAAAFIDNTSDIRYALTAPTLYLRSNVASDTVTVNSRFLIVEGWD